MRLRCGVAVTNADYKRFIHLKPKPNHLRMRLGVGPTKFTLRFTLGMNLEQRLTPTHDIPNGFAQPCASGHRGVYDLVEGITCNPYRRMHVGSTRSGTAQEQEVAAAGKPAYAQHLCCLSRTAKRKVTAQR